MTLIQVEQNVAQCVRCPYCSMTYEMRVDVEDGKLVNVHIEDAPRQCKRCGSPMDIEKVSMFANQKADEEAKLYGPLNEKIGNAK
jgi:primosomal protein N'